MSAQIGTEARPPTDEQLAEAIALLDAGDAAAAHQCVFEILRRTPDDPRALWLAGKIERLAGHFEQALGLLERCVELDPENVAGHLEIATITSGARDFERSLDELALALHYDPENAEAYFARGNVYRLQGELDRAIEDFNRAIAADPGHVRANTELGWIHLSRERYDDAVGLLERAVELDPLNIPAQNNLGYTYVKLEQYDRALEVFSRLCRDTHRSLLWPRLNLGNALDHTGRVDEAEEIYDRILEVEPHNFAARWNRAHNLLARGEFARGWREYEYRFQVEGVWHPRLVPFPPWKGEPLAGKTLLISAEQGLGDQIMFSSCLKEVAAQAERVILECDHRLAALLQRSFPEVRVIGSRHELIPPWLRDVGTPDYHVPAGSLPGRFRNTPADFPRHNGYLVADPDKVAHWRNRLDALGPGLKIGLSWRGGTSGTRRLLRSLTLHDLLPMLRISGCRFVSLQYGDVAQELEEFRAESGFEVSHWQDAIDDYDETAALVTALDMTVSVCTAVIHLNGALGKTVWIMVPYVAEWRYGRSGEGMPWYPSARLFRQDERGEWEPVLAEVTAALRARAGG